MPVLEVPITYEQSLNADIVRAKEIGIAIDYREINEEDLKDRIQYMLQNNEAQRNIKEMAKTLNDSRTHPLQVCSSNKKK